MISIQKPELQIRVRLQQVEIPQSDLMQVSGMITDKN